MTRVGQGQFPLHPLTSTPSSISYGQSFRWQGIGRYVLPSIFSMREFTRRSGGPIVSVNLKGLPRTALPNDVRRLCGKSKVENVSVGEHSARSRFSPLIEASSITVAMNYSRFRPNGTATLSFTRPEFVPAAVKALDKSVIGGKSISAEPTDDIPVLPRTRGSKGLLDAAQRGIYQGNGPSAGVPGGAKTVVLSGLPTGLLPVRVVDSLRGFKLARSEMGSPAVVKAFT